MTAPGSQGEEGRCEASSGQVGRIDHLCRLTGISRAGYYRNWRESEPRREETALRDRLQCLALDHRRYGYRRLGVLLQREGFAVNHKRLLRMMHDDNLLCLKAKPFVPVTTDSRHGWQIVPNLARGLILTGIDQFWVADITYIHLAEEFVYLAVILDAFSRRVIGWALEDHLRASLALAALDMAIKERRPGRDQLIHHSDRGVQYACGDYAARLAESGIRASMSRVGNPYDNAKAERFMRTLKEDEVDGQSYRDAAAAREGIGMFIEQVYNRHRLHSALDYVIPMARISDSSACLGIPRGSGFMVCFALYVGRSARDGDIDHTYGSYGL